MTISVHQACYFSHELTRLGEVGQLDRLSTTLFDSKVDLNPHQIDAALFALSNPLQKGVILADEVGLGKTIEAGLVLCQRWAERKRKLIVVCPAHIRKQWQTELSEKFNLPSIVIDRKVWNISRRDGNPNPFDCGKIVIISYGFAARMKDDLRAVAFDLVVFDEAHKLRNAYQPSRKGGQAVRWAFELRSKILLTATPLQNSLLELYGLGWVIGDHIFGDKNSFQRKYCNSGGNLQELRDRLKLICKRTLRKDCPYVNYTKRQAMTHSFKQTDEEKKLHQDVTDFMQRDISFAFPQQQRHLIEINLFKTLASSPQALASTLRTMKSRLTDIRDGLADDKSNQYIEDIIEDGDLDIECVLELMDNAENEHDDQDEVIDAQLLQSELSLLDRLIDQTERITSDSKSRALLTALEAAFTRLSELGANRKAVIFTESRKTQAFLAAYLESNGYKNKVVMFNGSNNHPAAKKAFTNFMNNHAGSDKITGSKPIDIRSALIEEFRDRGEILLATEAAAEGINLQFSSLVVNYDLPWNPQRIEQRIGRCHRYGQLHDVIVVNFLSQDNYADRRVQALLQQKFGLFDGVFGASDEVIGTIEDNVDFERRVLGILKSCRTNQEIESAFDKLQLDLEDAISKKMTQAREQLMEHFDADVHEVLSMQGKHALAALDLVGERFWKLTRWALKRDVNFNEDRLAFNLIATPDQSIPPGEYRLISAAKTDDDFADTEAHLLRISSPLGQWILNKGKNAQPDISTVSFDISGHHKKISMLAPLVGSCGWMRVDKLTIDSDTREEYLLLTAVNDKLDNLDQEIIQKLLDVSGIENDSIHLPLEISERLLADANRLSESTITKASENSNTRFKQITSQINQWADDKISAAEIELDSTKRELKSARRQAELSETISLRQDAEEAVAKLERQQRRMRRSIFDLEDEIEIQRKKLIGDLKDRAKNSTKAMTLFTLRWIAE